MSTKYVRELLESVDFLNPERAEERIGEALQELRQVEAARAKDAELIQMAVDACSEPHKMSLASAFLDAAKAAGFKPSDSTN